MNHASLDSLDITPDHQVDNSTEKQVEYFYHVLKQPDRPTAMLFYWSFAVPAIFAVAQRLNLQIPRDLSVMTFAGESHQRVGLNTTAMLEPESKMGNAAVDMLWEKIESEKERCPSKKLDFFFVDMHTCAPI
jgi:DNA-binding LacI/PurR family transcriptional regulator